MECVKSFICVQGWCLFPDATVRGAGSLALRTTPFLEAKGDENGKSNNDANGVSMWVCGEVMTTLTSHSNKKIKFVFPTHWDWYILPLLFILVGDTIAMKE